MAVSFVSNIKQVKRELNAIERKQLPFAVSLALNNTAFSVRTRIVTRTYPRAFPQARNKSAPRVAFRVDKSSKRNLNAAVYAKPKFNFLEHHITGRDKRPFRSSALAVPIQAQRTQGGKIRASDRPGGADQFVADFGSGPAIWRERKGEVQMLFVLKQSTRVDRRFHFYTDGQSTADRSFPFAFDKALARALRTAR